MALFPRPRKAGSEFGDETLREVIFQNYRIVYCIDGDRVGVVVVRHGAMHLPADVARSPWNLPWHSRRQLPPFSPLRRLHV